MIAVRGEKVGKLVKECEGLEQKNIYIYITHRQQLVIARGKDVGGVEAGIGWGNADGKILLWVLGT